MISILLMALAFICFGVMDELAHHYDSIQLKLSRSFWDKRISWKNKWKANKKLSGISYTEEKFWGSSRWFVFLTDGWHLVQFIAYQLLATAGAFALSESAWVALLLSIPLHVGLTTIKAVTMKVV